MGAHVVYCVREPLKDPKGAMRDLIAYLQPPRVLLACRARWLEIPPVADPPTRVERLLGVTEMSDEVAERLADAAGGGGCLAATFGGTLAHRLTRGAVEWGEQTGLGRCAVSGFHVCVGDVRVNVRQFGEEPRVVHATAVVRSSGMGTTADPEAARAGILGLPIVREIAAGLTPILGAPEVLVWWESAPVARRPAPRREPTFVERILAPIDSEDEEIPVPRSFRVRCEPESDRLWQTVEGLLEVCEEPARRVPLVEAFASALVDLFVCNEQLAAEDREALVGHIVDRVERNLWRMV